MFVPNDDAILDIMFLVKPLTGRLNSIACIKNLPKKNHVFLHITLELILNLQLIRLVQSCSRDQGDKEQRWS